MSRAAPHSRARAPRGFRLGDVVRASMSLLVLLCAGVGLPLVLGWASPRVWARAQDDLVHLLDGQDTAGVLLLLLTAVGWLAWATFAVSCFLEAAAQMGGRAARRRRVLGPSQRLAAALVGSVLVLLPTSQALASPALAQPAAATAAPTPSADPKATPAASPSASSATATYTVRDVRPAETLGSIAERLYGDFTQWRAIAAVNEGRTLPDGSQFRAESRLPVDWTLKLPAPPNKHAEGASASPTTASASNEAAPTTTPETVSSSTTSSTRSATPASPRTETESSSSKKPQSEEHTHTVRAGETLWDIADDELDDPTQWRQLYSDNRQPDGPLGDDPDLIYPGQSVTVPSAGEHRSPAPPTENEDSESHGEHEDQRAPQDAPSSSPSEAPQGGESTDDTPSAEPAPGESGGQDAAEGGQAPGAGRSSSPSAPSSPSSSATAGQPTSQAQTPISPAVLAAGGLGVVAAGVLATLATRRVLQQRRRRHGRRIAMPQGTASAAEEEMRASPLPDQLQLVERVLRTLAAHLADEQRALPRLQAVVVDSSTLRVHLSEPAAAVAPFHARAGLWQWECPLRESDELLDEEEASHIEPPYPGLVGVGHTPEGALVLADLEEIGGLQLVGPQAVLYARSLAIELACSEQADLDIDLGPALAEELVQVCERLVAHEDIAGVLEELRVHHRQQQRALQELEMDSLRQARLGEPGLAAWTPRIALVQAEQPEMAEELLQLVAEEPRTAAAVIVATPHTPAPEGGTSDAGGWVLYVEEGTPIRVPGTTVEILPQLLSEQQYADVIEMLATSLDERDVPAPPPPESGPEAEQDVLAASPAVSLHKPLEETDPGFEAGKDAPDERFEDDATVSALFAGMADLTDTTDGETDSAEEAESASDDGPEPAFDDGADSSAPSSTVPAHAGPADGVTVVLPQPTPPPDTTSATSDGPRPPRLLLLGPVEVHRTAQELPSKRLRMATELVALLHLRPHTTTEGVTQALWHGDRVQPATVRQLISRTRSWLGTRPDGDPWLATHPGARGYSLADISSDWHTFQQLAAAADHSHLDAEQSTLLLEQALGQVRGQPLAGTPPTRYAWAEPVWQDMISVIVDVAQTLGERYLLSARPRDALWAASRGLEAAPEAEQLHRVRLQALHAVGDLDGVRRAADTLYAQCADLGDEPDAATRALLHDLLPSPTGRRS